MGNVQVLLSFPDVYPVSSSFNSSFVHFYLSSGSSSLPSLSLSIVPASNSHEYYWSKGARYTLIITTFFFLSSFFFVGWNFLTTT